MRRIGADGKKFNAVVSNANCRELTCIFHSPA